MTQYQCHQYRSTNRVATRDISECKDTGTEAQRKMVNCHFLPLEGAFCKTFLCSQQPICTSIYTLMWAPSEPVKFSIGLVASHTSRTVSVQQIHLHRWFPCRRKLNFIPHRCKRRRSCIWQYLHILISLIHIKTKRKRQILPGATAYACKYMHRQNLTDNDL